MEFFYYDIIFFAIFALIVGLFLYKNKKKLQIESKILLLYRTKFGLNFIEKVSSKAPWFFNFLAIVSIVCGYLLMIGGICLIVFTVFLIYSAVNLPKIPPLMPLVPYLPSMFKIKFLPPFYFTYWLISIALVAICHEFMHGTFARFYKIKLKSTGFGFLGPFLAAFVEIDEKKMAKKPVKQQLAVLSGGSFANLILAILFVILLNGFCTAAFVQSGVIIPQLNVDGVIVPSYIMSAVNISDVKYQNNAVNLTELKSENKTDFKLESNIGNYYLTKEILSITPNDTKTLIVYADTPAYNLKMKGIIQKINGNEIKNYTEFLEALKKLNPGDNVMLQTSEGNYTFNMDKDPGNSSRGVIGFGFPKEQKGTLAGFISKLISKRDTFTYFSPKSDLSVFVYNLLLWIVLINISVMLINMLPFGIFDGGRFFYLTVLGITKSRKKAIKGFKVANAIILFIFILMMVIWLWRAF
jgi:membrane-associated protease RseP (regulator of RpoE activity)